MHSTIWYKKWQWNNKIIIFLNLGKNAIKKSFWIPNKLFKYTVFAFLCRNCVFFYSHIVLIPRDFFVLSHPHLLSNDAASFVYTGDLQSQMIRGSMRKKTSSWSQNLARSTSQKNKWERGCSFWLFPLQTLLFNSL